MQKVAVELERGRPKLENSRCKTLNLRVTNFEYEKISRLAEKLNISKTETIVRAINLLETHKPKKYKSFAKSKTSNEPGVVRENSDDN